MSNLIFTGRSSSTDGEIIITDAEGARRFKTLACPHCNGHFIVIPGSGRVRHFCQDCYAPTCDKAKCHEHNPFARKLDLVEAGKIPLSSL